MQVAGLRPDARSLCHNDFTKSRFLVWYGDKLSTVLKEVSEDDIQRLIIKKNFMYTELIHTNRRLLLQIFVFV